MSNQPNTTAPAAAETPTAVKAHRLHIKLTKSPIGSQARARRTLDALGIGKMGSSVTQPDNPSIRGMLYLVAHLVTVTEIEE